MEKFRARKPEKDTISMRISTDKLAEIDVKAAAIGINRNEFINQMIDYALSNQEDTTKKITARTMSIIFLNYYIQ